MRTLAASPVYVPHPSDRYSFHAGHMLLGIAAGFTLALAGVGCIIGYSPKHADVVPTYALHIALGGGDYILDTNLTADDCIYAQRRQYDDSTYCVAE